MIFDAEGAPLSPSHANKKGRRYRYYVSRDIVQHGIKQEGWRVPAAELEGATKRALCSLLNDETRLADELSLSGSHETRSALSAASEITERIDRALLIQLELSVALRDDGLALSLERSKLRDALGLSANDSVEGRMTVEVPLQIRRRGAEMKLVIGARNDDVALVDPTLVRSIARGHGWFEDLLSGDAASILDIAKREGVTMRYVSQHIDLAFLSPTIVESILQGRQPIEMTSQSLKQIDLPIAWNEQATALGF